MFQVFGEDFDLGGKDKGDQNKDKGLLGGFEPLVAGVKSVLELRGKGRLTQKGFFCGRTTKQKKICL